MALNIDTATGQASLFEHTEEYDAFVDKFKIKLTTDDCYTPENVFEAVADWVSMEYSLDRADFVRPFWPGGDYQAFEYPDGCVVVDNPPFSIRAEIIKFYLARNIRFFLFSPALSLITRSPVCHIATGANITYENGAEVPTSFVTNLEDTALRTAPALYQAIDRVDKENRRAMHKQLPKYYYPDYVITAAIAQRWCHYGVEYRLERKDCMRISGLDAQKPTGKSIYGGGYLLSERAAAERAAAERAAATRWPLSERERELVRGLGG